MAASLLLTSPGTPFLYYGEEIGMQGRKPDEDIRLPMQWSGEANTGFSAGKPWRSPDVGYPQVNVEAQLNDPDSLLSHYRTLIHLRRANPALSGDGIQLLGAGNPGLYAALRYNHGQFVLVLVNLTGEPIDAYTLELDDAVLQDGTYNVNLLLGQGETAPLRVEDGKVSDYLPLKVLPPYSTFIMQLIP